jgi:hypothetical protein
MRAKKSVTASTAVAAGCAAVLARLPHLPGESHRHRAHRVAAYGVGLLANALNACDAPNSETPYRYAPEARREFMRLVGEIRELVETGRILANPIGVARNDVRFQKFLAVAMSKPRRHTAAGRALRDKCK